MKYCLGLKFSHVRPMTALERDWLEKALKLAIQWRKSMLAGIWFTPIWILFLFNIVPTQVSKQSQEGLTMLAFVVGVNIAMFIGPAAVIMLAIDAKRRVRILRQSLSSSIVEVFEGSGVENPLVVNRIPESGLLLDGFYPAAKPKYAPIEVKGADSVHFGSVV